MLIEHTTIACKSATSNITANGTLEVVLVNPATSDLLMGFELAEIIDHFGADKILSQIGEYEAANHFNLFTDSDVEDNMKPLRTEIENLKAELKEA